MPVAEIIAIGTELLLGEIQDTNTQYLARFLRDHGIDLYRTTIIGDNIERVAQVINESSSRSQIIITTGGLGPTIDDPTRHAVALSQGVKLEYREDLWSQIEDRFRRYNRKPTENNRRQAYIPQGATPVENPVGTAPCFIIEDQNYCIISLPGVPREMEYLMTHSIYPYLKNRFKLEGMIIKARVLHTSGIGESQVDEWISDLEMLNNPTVGLLAHSGQVDIRITAKAESESEADRQIEKIAADLYSRLRNHIYGENEQTLEQTVLDLYQENRITFIVCEFGLDNMLSKRLDHIGFPAHLIHSSLSPCSRKELENTVDNYIEQHKADAGLGALLENSDGTFNLHLYWKSPDNIKTYDRSFGGAPELVTAWATNTSLDFLRRKSKH